MQLFTFSAMAMRQLLYLEMKVQFSGDAGERQFGFGPSGFSLYGRAVARITAVRKII